MNTGVATRRKVSAFRVSNMRTATFPFIDSMCYSLFGTGSIIHFLLPSLRIQSSAAHVSKFQISFQLYSESLEKHVYTSTAQGIIDDIQHEIEDSHELVRIPSRSRVGRQTLMHAVARARAYSTKSLYQGQLATLIDCLH